MIYEVPSSHESARELPLPVHLKSRPVVGFPLVSRRDTSVGYAFDLLRAENQACSGELHEGSDTQVQCSVCTAAMIRRIGTSLYAAHAAPFPGVVREVSESVVGARTVVKIDASVLTDTRVVEALADVARMFSQAALVLTIAFPTSSIRRVSSLRAFRSALFRLEDNGVEALVSNPQWGGFGRNLRKVLERSVSGVLVTPGWMGIGEADGSCSRSKFEASLNTLSGVVHKLRQVVVFEDVRTLWQRDAVRGVPFVAYSGQLTNTQVVV